MLNRLEEIKTRFKDLEVMMTKPEIISNQVQMTKISKEYRNLENVNVLWNSYQNISNEINENKELIDSEDIDMSELASSENEELEKELAKIYEELNLALIPKDATDEADAIIEIRAGTGGDEAAIFGNDLLRMYTRYAENQKWKMNILSSSYSETGGIKEIVVEISGEGTFSKLKHESGVHRVQRVPKTESQGRIHTSTATVAVLPKSEEIDIEIKDDDIRTDVFHSGGAGGQNVNKVATAIRLTHSPSGIVVSCQNERSQLQNKIQAMEILKSKLWDLEIQKQQNERSEARKSQVGSGGRSEKIRTYNYPQGRITDHRIKLTSHRLSEFMDGLIDEIIEPLMKDEQAKKMISNKSNE
ncbi:MAG: peptide chain release factor 1 [SAR202 cluster bacterium]|nr:MAG: peptide chain release factor 1 [SAR202 cluster bacterium]MQG11996.1 peptide chain release factor 1 [SAR202 cluster bacterium]